MTRQEAINIVSRIYKVADISPLVDSLIALDILKVEKEYTPLDLAREALRVQRFQTVDRGAAMLAPEGIELVLGSLTCIGLAIVKA